MYRCKVLKDSVSPWGKRLTTFEIEFPRKVLAETVTHRMDSDTWLADIGERTKTPDISKNSASSRAIPFARMLEKVLTDPYVPEKFSANQAGMQEAGFLEGDDHDRARSVWLESRDSACRQALRLLSPADRAKLYQIESPVGDQIRLLLSDRSGRPSPSVSVHKQDINRLLEPWGWVLQVVTSTEWDNFFTLRCDPAADPAFRKIARIMYVMMQRSIPEHVPEGCWHLPYVDAPAFGYGSGGAKGELCELSAARCAWTSYWPPEGGDGSDAEKVERTLKKLRESRPIHPSPFEHQATPLHPDRWSDATVRSNLRGWLQYRKTIDGEVAKYYRPSRDTVDSWGVTEEVIRLASS